MAEATTDEPLSIDILPDTIVTMSGEGISTDGLVFKMVAFTGTGLITHSRMPVKVNIMFDASRARDTGIGLIVAAFFVEQAST